MPPIREANPRAARALSLLRLALGLIFVVAATGKFTLHPVFGAVPLPVVSAEWQRELPERLAAWLSGHSGGVLAAIVRDVLIPNGRVVAAAVAWLQLAAGVGLVLGLFTRIAAIAAALVAGALAIAAAARQDLDARPYALLVLIAVALLIGGAGKYAGIDRWRAERRRNREL